MTPSSAATTRMITSVMFAPRSRMSEKAACPGVSSIVMEPSRVVSLYAPMFCVMPPASPAATETFRGGEGEGEGSAFRGEGKGGGEGEGEG